MAKNAMATEAPTRKDVMDFVASAMKEAGFPAVEAEQWELGGIAEKPEFANFARTVQEIPEVQALNVESAGDSVFGEHSGASSMTARFVRRDMEIGEAVSELADSGQIEAALNAVYERCGDKHLAIDVVQYLLFLFAKGWVAEKALAQTDRFSKVSESQDIGGQDFYDNAREEYVQVKAASHGFRAYQDSGATGNHVVDGVPVVYYQFDDTGSIHVADAHTDANGAAADAADAKKTAMWKNRIWA